MGSTHSWIAKFLYKIFAMGANRADEVGQIKAVLITQGISYESEELGVSYGHQSESEAESNKAEPSRLGSIMCI